MNLFLSVAGGASDGSSDELRSSLECLNLYLQSRYEHRQMSSFMHVPPVVWSTYLIRVHLSSASISVFGENFGERETVGTHLEN